MGDLATAEDDGEKAQEQRYFDDAREHRERARHRHEADPGAATANPKDAATLHRLNEALRKGFRPPEEAVAFGRVDTDEGERFYVGHQIIWDADNEPLVVNWQAPVGTMFYEASEADRRGVTRRRRFDCEENTILAFEDDLVAELARLVAGPQAEAHAEPGGAREAGGALDGVDDALLAELERARTVEMGDIVRTIRAAQHRIFRAGLDRLLLVQGGPGTGKTVVALHRVSWLLYNHRDTLAPEDVLVVGPNPTFVRYIRNVLPGLGDRDVEQLPLAALGPDVRLGRAEPPEVAALKGSARMAGLLDRGLADRISLPDGEGPLQLPVGNRVVRFDRPAVQAEVDRLRQSPYAVGRRALREFLVRGVRQEGTPEARSDAADPLVERIWPQLSAPAFLQDLLGSEPRLLRAAGEHFTAREIMALHRRSADRLSAERWSAADVALLDHVQARMAGQPDRRYRHVVIDEAQDLSPMQLASIGRRSEAGSMTVLGDIAQSTGPWARDSWDDVVTALGAGRTVEKAELAVGYRVPRQAYEVAARLLPVAAPGVRPPRVVRDGPDPAFHRAGDGGGRAARAVEEAMAFAARGLLVGVIRPAACAGELADALAAHQVMWSDASADGLATGINVFGPDQVKGLEFDAVVVVEPELIAAEGGGGAAGLRRLYVALTRTTRHLSVVHVGRPLPDVTAYAPPRPAPPVPSPVAVPSARRNGVNGAHHPAPARRPAARAATRLAQSFVDEVRSSVDPALWPQVADEVARLLAPEARDDAKPVTAEA